MGRRRGFLGGVLCGVLLVFGARVLINRSTVPDQLVAPLLIADTNGQAQAIVVLGASVVGECTTNLSGFRRVMLATRLWREKRAPLMVFTGGPMQTSCPIAVAMARLARDVGVDEASIHVETASRSTHENAELAAPLLRRLGARRLLLVTDRLHMRRAAGAFAQLGFEIERASVPIYEGHLNNVGMLASGMREMVALAVYRTRGWIGSGSATDVAPVHGETVAVSRSDMHMSNPSGPLVVLGASYAGGWKIERVAGMPVINRGVSGQQSFEVLERFERDVVAAAPRAVILWGFINDIFRAHGDVNAAVARARESFVRMIALAREHGIEPVLATEVTIRPAASWMNTLGAIVGALRGKQSYQAGINRHVIETNRWLVDLARRENLLLLDLQSTLSDGSGMRRAEFAQADGSHISPAGYRALTDYATPALEKHLVARAGAAGPR